MGAGQRIAADLRRGRLTPANVDAWMSKVARDKGLDWSGMDWDDLSRAAVARFRGASPTPDEENTFTAVMHRVRQRIAADAERAAA